MKVPNDERVANDIGPESCAAAREGRREALTGVRLGWPLSRESKLQSADAVSKAEGHMDGGVSASLCPALRGLRPQHGRKLPVREPGYLACRSGPFAWPAGGGPCTGTAGAAATAAFLQSGLCVYVNGQYVGSDPDPNIRAQLQRRYPGGQW